LVVGLTLVQIGAFLVLPRGLAITAVSDVVEALLMLALLMAFAENAKPLHGRLRAFWVMLAVGWAISLVNQLWWMYYDLLLQKPIPMLFAGDVLLFLPGILMLAGFLLRPHLQQSKRSARLGLLDFLLLMSWWVYFYVFLVMCWQYVSPNEDIYNRNYDRLYLLEILVLVIVVALLIKQSAGTWRRYYGLFLATVLFNYLSFALQNRAIELGTYYSGSWYDCLFVVALSTYMFVALKGRSLRLIADNAGGEKYGSWIAGLAIVAVLSLPVSVLYAALEGGVSQGVVHFRVLVSAVAIFAMAGLVFVKQQLLHEELRKANDVLEESSTTDPLTGIRNRRFFSATIQADIARTVRAYVEGDDRNTRDLIFYVIDLDDFKRVNDVHGHDAGDRVLIETSRRISTAIRNSDVLVRWGGEEFLVVSRYNDRRNADILAQRVLQAIRGRAFAISPGEQVRQTCSVGWAAFPWFEDDVDALGYEHVLRQADRGLYKAKRAGKNQAVGMIAQCEEGDAEGNLEPPTDPQPSRANRRPQTAEPQGDGAVDSGSAPSQSASAFADAGEACGPASSMLLS
jgi:diguanylate cyclase (GGDEF)-like protein